jgi:hypothetical protein
VTPTTLLRHYRDVAAIPESVPIGKANGSREGTAMGFKVNVTDGWKSGAAGFKYGFKV